MEIVIILIPFFLSILLGRYIIPYIIYITYKKRLFDPIDSRKVHQSITPRLGGVAFVPIQCVIFGITSILVYKIPLISSMVLFDRESWAIMPMFILFMCGLFILYILGVADDLVGVSYKFKFFIQFLVASFLPISGLWINDLYGVGFLVEISPWVGVPFTIFVVILIINAINLIDGLDGLCSGLAAVACLVLGCLFAYYDSWSYSLLAFITLGILISFFYYNVFGTTKRRRRIFMGDTGSMTLGYTLAFLAISFSMRNHSIKPFSEGAIVVAASTLIVPVFDVARVMVVRFLTKSPLFKADRNHLHHKLLRAGMSHKQAMMSIIGLSLFFCALNIALVQYISNNLLLILNFVIWLVLTAIFNFIVNNRDLRKSNQVS